MILERLTAFATVSPFLALNLHRTWLAASDSHPPIAMRLATLAAGAQSAPIDVKRFDPNGGEILIARADRKAGWRPERLRASEAERGR